MAKKTRAKSSVQKADSELALEKNVDSLLAKLPGGRKGLAQIQDDKAKEMLSLARGLLSEAKKKLGPSKPRVRQVADLFEKYAETDNAPNISEEFDRELRDPEVVQKIAKLDNAHDKAVATALNDFDQISNAESQKIEDANDSWSLAVRVYSAESRTAGAVFHAQIEHAKTSHDSGHGSHAENLPKLVRHYMRSSAIADGLVAYEKSMAKATDDLSTAFGSLVNDLFASTASISTGEAALIEAIQKASLDFWKKSYAEIDKARS